MATRKAMSPEFLTLGRRAVACKGFRWMPGALARYPDGAGLRIQHIEEVVPFFGSRAVDHAIGEAVPDLSDPATLGCLLALVREAWGQGDMGASRWTIDGPKSWCIEFTGSDDYEGPGEQCHAWYGATEGEALVRALEAAS